MQDYGEVVCCVGSSANILNNGIFLQADCRYVKYIKFKTEFLNENIKEKNYLESIFIMRNLEKNSILGCVFSIAVEPQYPQACSRSTAVVEPWDDDLLTPVNLAHHLQSIPCSLSFHIHDNISITELIAQVGVILFNCQ